MDGWRRRRARSAAYWLRSGPWTDSSTSARRASATYVCAFALERRDRDSAGHWQCVAHEQAHEQRADMFRMACCRWGRLVQLCHAFRFSCLDSVRLGSATRLGDLQRGRTDQVLPPAVHSAQRASDSLARSVSKVGLLRKPLGCEALLGNGAESAALLHTRYPKEMRAQVR